jgi:ankyrin repeat protein
MTDSSDDASTKRELEALRKKVAWAERVAARLPANSEMEVRNQLIAITAGTQLLKDELDDLFASIQQLPSTQQGPDLASRRELCDEAASVVRESLTRLETWVLSVIHLATVPFGKLQLALCQLHDIIDWTLNRLVKAAEAKHVDIQVSGLSGLPTIEADSRQLRMVLRHLIEDAIAQMPESSVIAVRGEMDSRQEQVRLRLAFPSIARTDDLPWCDIVVHVMEEYGGAATTDRLPEGGFTMTLCFPIGNSPGEDKTDESGRPIPLEAESFKIKRLFEAVRIGDSVRIKKLLEQRAPVNAQDESGDTPLHVATLEGHAAVVELLLNAGAHVNGRAGTGLTALHVAVFWNDQGDVTEALLRAGADVNAQDVHGHTPLHLAAERGRPAMAKLLLDAGAMVTATDHQSRTPLHLALHGFHAAVVELLVGAGAPVNAQDANGNTPLHLTGNRNCAATLLKGRPDVNVRNNQGQTPLHCAAKLGHPGLVKTLLEAGATVNATDQQGQTPLQLAANKGYATVVDVLRAADGWPGATAPTSAEKRDEVGAAPETMAPKGTVVNVPGESAETLLRRAANEGDEAAVRLLLEQGAAVNAADEHGATPLHEAASSGQEAVVRLLLEHGADVNAADKYGETPLRIATEKGYTPAAVTKLLRKANLRRVQ